MILVTKENIIKFIKAELSSNISAVVDLGLYYLISNNSNKFYIIMFATIIYRITYATINFIINKFWAFKSTGKTTKEALYFFILFIVKMLLSGLLVYLISKFIKLNNTIIKIFVDILLFFISYYIQNKYIFKNKNIAK